MAEDKEAQELLARIGQLAGQINRHKNQRAGHYSSNGSQNSQHRPSRYSSAGRGGYRVGRPPATHHHRTLHLNNSQSSSASTTPTPGAASDTPGWVSRTDRHRQLINANVYEQKSQSRAKAIEETRQKKLKDRRTTEKTRISRFLQQQARAPSASDGAAAGAANEITIEGIRFVVKDGGKKLIRQTGTASSTPKTATVAGVKFHRTKTGNLVIDRVVRSHRRSGPVKKLEELCRTFSTTGSCPKGPSCRYTHDPNKVAICKDFLKDGKCANGEFCDLSHDLSPERVPDCLHYAKGNCSKIDCPYTHSTAPPNAPVCRAFGFRGFCIKGAYCHERHVFECPDFSNTGVCKNKGCKLLHRERASMLRNQAKQDEAMEDVSSDDDEPVDSDDVDSDAVAELLEADSDDSDFDNAKDYIAL